MSTDSQLRRRKRRADGAATSLAAKSSRNTPQITSPATSRARAQPGDSSGSASWKAASRAKITPRNAISRIRALGLPGEPALEAGLVLLGPPRPAGGARRSPAAHEPPDPRSARVARSVTAGAAGRTRGAGRDHVRHRSRAVREDGRVTPRYIGLFWRIFVPNAAVLAVACVVLMIQPANGRVPRWSGA
jgi:hypothetical protein